ncbi:MAG: hypothetical protein RL497_1814 [Pseudomonadota bacterium]|jgi:predicted enzyme related to lactoylglutathione lyase
MKPVALLIHVRDWEIGFSWYKAAFPSAVVVELPDFNFRALQMGDFLIEVVRADEKVPSGKSGTVLYWAVLDLLEAIKHFKHLGSEIYRGPIPIENGQGMCQVTDPFGNLIGLRGPFNP